MHMLAILILMTAVYQHPIARAIDFCEPEVLTSHSLPIAKTAVNNKSRVKCVAGYVRKAGTSNQYTCLYENGKLYWKPALSLTCIRDPNLPNVPTTAETHPLTSSTTEKSEITKPDPSTATGYITNQVVTTETRRTTTLPTLTSTTKEAGSITTTNEITSSTSSSYTSKEYKTTTSSHTLSSSLTTTPGVTTTLITNNTGVSAKTSSGKYISTISGVTIIIFICMVATLFIFWWRSKHQERPRETIIQVAYTSITGMDGTGPVFKAERCIDEQNIEVNTSNTDSVNDTTQGQTCPAQNPDTCNKLLPQEELQP